MNQSPYTLRAAMVRQRALIFALIGLLATVLIALLVDVSTGGFALAGLLLCLAVVRLVVPARRLGGLVIRRRVIDAVILLVLAGGLLLLSSSPNL
ncbi:DUF3017 domain-containing protein [Helcobacillus massiliensis]|uniref:DUF3017 domain-containing protein n=1 Tax=Helcobacillus massiliensis TaxID=521392 RepID=UPI0021A5D299|nr:DUF3017 domain-containing protein [Helcobacillus massiliensis]MCT1558333.1 DUF3017 domain-containing protein [Helcobacillus massiliensis]MCT2037318.1 DUF3017 domain-containing protein [Helcobacillus massiliensis]MCT2332338.1 DUF3017 domain-containing protein [Helcobacillus massiliensis]